MAHSTNGQPIDPGTRLVLEELRDFRKEAQADRRQAALERRQAAADTAAERRRAAVDRRRYQADRRRYAADQRRYTAERRQSDERFERIIQEFREDSIRREAKTDKKFEQIRVVGMAILKTLERIERNTGIRRNGPSNNGR
jgi:hypothetical protein